MNCCKFCVKKFLIFKDLCVYCLVSPFLSENIQAVGLCIMMMKQREISQLSSAFTLSALNFEPKCSLDRGPVLVQGI